MRIEQLDGKYVICRGDAYRPSYFSFYVGADRSAWSIHEFQAQRYATEAAAQEGIAALRQRDKTRRQRRRNS